MDSRRRRDPRDVLEGDALQLRDDAPPGLFLSRRGNWFHDGQRVGHERLEALLTASISRNDAGGLIVTTGRDVMEFAAEDAPFFVVSVDIKADEDAVIAVLNDGSREVVVGSIVVGADDRWRMRVKCDRFWALFTRGAAQMLEASVEEAGDGLAVVVGATTLPLTSSPKTTWSD